MKALSLTQPWADVVIDRDKRIENRVPRGPWRGGCAHRGPVLLHASLGLGTRAQIDERVEIIRRCGIADEWISTRLRRVFPANSNLPPYWAPAVALRLGGVVGIAKLVDVITPSSLFDEDEIARVESTYGLTNQRRFWFGGFALVLADVRALPFRPCKGALGLFELPDSYAEAA